MKNFPALITVSFVLGLLLSYYKPFEFILIALFVLTLVFLNIRTIKNDVFYISIIFLFLGLFVMEINLLPSELMKFEEREVDLLGRVKEKRNIDKEVNNYIIQVNSFEFEGSNHLTRELVRLKVIGEETLEIGDIISFRARVRMPQGRTNPKLYDFKSHLESKGIRVLMTSRYNNISIHSNKLSYFEKMQEKFTNRVLKVIDESIRSENKNLLKAMILGDSSYLEDSQVLNFRNLGLSHLLAISGLHIGILIGFLMFCMANLGIKRGYSTLVSMLIIWIYSGLVGNPPSILRANMMWTILSLSRYRLMPYNSINSLFISMFCLLIYNPFYINNLGFQLSYLASISIIIGNKKIKELFYPLDNRCVQDLFILLSLQVGMLPVQAYYFNQISLIGILANLVMVPILSLSLVLTFILLIVSFFTEIFSGILGSVISVFLNLVIKLEILMSKAVCLNLRVKSPEIEEIILFYILIFVLLRKEKVFNLSYTMKKLLAFFIITYTIIFNLENSKEFIEIHFIDVGQGDSILIRGKEDYLIDTGGSPLDGYNIPENITIPYLKKHGVFNLRAMFLSHFHEDHVQGVPKILEELKVQNTYISYPNEENVSYMTLKESNMEVNVLEKNDIISLEENLKILILSPKGSNIARGDSENNLSLVILLQYGSNKFLFMGDAEKEAEIEILKAYNLGSVNLLKLGHHGSSTSTTEVFLKSVDPEKVFISVGRNNLYGHPDREVLNRLDKIETYRTDRDGRILVKLMKDSVEVQSFLDKKDISFYKLALYMGLNIFLAWTIAWIYRKDRYGGFNES